jgi:hypothetical protein
MAKAPGFDGVAGIAPGLAGLLTRSLAEDPAERPSAAELAGAPGDA